MPFIYRDGSMMDLNDLIGDDSGWILESAMADQRRLIRVVGMGELNRGRARLIC